ncbi:HNH endonuclease [Candidatus Omnitrophota bacterium]
MQRPEDLKERHIWVKNNTKCKNPIKDLKKHDLVAIYNGKKEHGAGAIVALATVSRVYDPEERSRGKRKSDWFEVADLHKKLIAKNGKCPFSALIPIIFPGQKFAIGNDGEREKGRRLNQLCGGTIGWLNEQQFENITQYFNDYLKESKKRTRTQKPKKTGKKDLTTKETRELIDAVEEGEKYRAQIELHRRKASLIIKKKRGSDYRCEVCGSKYRDIYGEIGEEFIVAHHDKPLGNRPTSSPTELKDIRLVCSNCHDMLHREEPPITIEALRKIIEEQKSRKT